ncbi:MAG TPA: DNA polymerase I, partial [Candidatus Saccharimonadales bacterium]|nr:DNA polymerase I [Candidatus Saccharimonadales bacterium]
MAERRKKLAIIDGKSVFYRGYYAMPNLSSTDGTPTGGVYGFAAMALELIKKLQPDYVCVAWDKPKTNIRARLKIYPEYKAGRKPAPDDFKVQIPLLHELLDAFGWPLYELDDYEADDIMGTLAVQARDKDIETLLITSDLDMLQLVNAHTHVYALKKGFTNIELFRPETFIFKYGLKPEQFIDLKALKGDSSDNIPGVPGVGEKTATELLKEYKTLDGVYKNLDQIKEATRKKLKAGKELAYLSKKLGALWLDAPIKLNLNHVDGSKCDPHRIQEVLQALEFRTLARQLPEIMKIPESEDTTQPAKLQMGSSSHIKTAEELDNFDLPGGKELVIHSTSAHPHGREPRTLTISPEPKLVITIDLSIDDEKIRAKLKDCLENKSLIGYDIKSTLQILRTLGIYPKNIAHDVMIGAFLINPLRRVQNLEDIAAEELNIHLTVDDREAEAVVAVIRALHDKQTKELIELPTLTKLAREVEWPIIPVLADMEYEGIKLDSGYLKLMAAQVDDMVTDLEQQIYGFADQEFNISSPGQLADVLFNKLKLPVTGIKKGKTAFSTAASELEKLRGKHPIIELITQYREVTKLANTYIEPLPNMVDENSRLHTTFSLTVAPTGRLSSSDPNLQNIPTRTELGKRIRTAFVAEKGKTLVSADYSQFELRIAAVLSKDSEMIKLFNGDADIHTI